MTTWRLIPGWRSFQELSSPKAGWIRAAVIDLMLHVAKLCVNKMLLFKLRDIFFQGEASFFFYLFLFSFFWSQPNMTSIRERKGVVQNMPGLGLRFSSYGFN